MKEQRLRGWENEKMGFGQGTGARLVNYFLWFVAGTLAGYLWMAKAYGLIF